MPTIPRLTAGLLLQDIPPLLPAEALGKAMHLFRTLHLTALPVVEGGLFLGWVREERVMDQVLRDAEIAPTLPVSTVLEMPPIAVTPQTELTAAFAIEMAEYEAVLIPVVGPNGQYLGALLRADIMTALAGRLAPARIGGMATPLGVYLYSESGSSGGSSLALALTGVMMALMMWLTQSLLVFVPAALYAWTRWELVAKFAEIFVLFPTTHLGPVSEPVYYWLQVLQDISIISVFLLLLRFTPFLAGYHAAEHQTVNAIEAGEPLTVEAVRRMPRVHPRCGTNLISLLQLTLLGITLLCYILLTSGYQHLDIVFAGTLIFIVFILAYWRRIGGWLQQYITTRPATDAELRSGIRAGQDILRQAHPGALPPLGFGRRFLRMGLHWVIIGLLAVQALQYLLQRYLDVWAKYLLK